MSACSVEAIWCNLLWQPVLNTAIVSHASLTRFCQIGWTESILICSLERPRVRFAISSNSTRLIGLKASHNASDPPTSSYISNMPRNYLRLSYWSIVVPMNPWIATDTTWAAVSALKRAGHAMEVYSITNFHRSSLAALLLISLNTQLLRSHAWGCEHVRYASRVADVRRTWNSILHADQRWERDRSIILESLRICLMLSIRLMPKA
jgi:hypothetical protein